MRFEGGALAEATNFIGAAYLRGFDVAPNYLHLQSTNDVI